MTSRPSQIDATTCPECRAALTAGKRKWCSPQCGDRARKRLARARRRDLVCARCDDPVPVGRRRYCSERCATAAPMATARERELAAEVRANMAVATAMRLDLELATRIGQASTLANSLSMARLEIQELRADATMLAQVAHRLFELRDWDRYGLKARELIERYLPPAA